MPVTAARELVEKRDNWLNPSGVSDAELKKRTLTNLYNARPMWLQLAHRALDEAVFRAYAWEDLVPLLAQEAKREELREEVLRQLLGLNRECAGD